MTRCKACPRGVAVGPLEVRVVQVVANDGTGRKVLGHLGTPYSPGGSERLSVRKAVLLGYMRNTVPLVRTKSGKVSHSCPALHVGENKGRLGARYGAVTY